MQWWNPILQDAKLPWHLSRFPQVSGDSWVHYKCNLLVTTRINAFLLMSDDRFSKLNKHFKDSKQFTFVFLLEKYPPTRKGILCTALHKACNIRKHSSTVIISIWVASYNIGTLAGAGIASPKSFHLCTTQHNCDSKYLASIQVSKQAVNIFIKITL